MFILTPLSTIHSAKGGDLPWTVVSDLLCTSLVDVDLTVFAAQTLSENTLELVREGPRRREKESERGRKGGELREEKGESQG